MKTMQLSTRLEKVKPSATLAITAKAKQMKAEGLDVISFGAGEPDFDTPENIKQAAIKALQEGFTKYTAASGLDEFKKEIVKKFKNDNQIDYETNQIVVSVGAKHSLFNIFQTILNDGDEVVIPSPYWLSYPEMVRLSGGEPVIINTTEKSQFKITPEQFRNSITSKTKALIINSPSNPTGMLYSEEELRAIAEIAVEKGVFIVSDEIYEKLVFDSKKFISVASLSEEIKSWTFTVNGMSKAYSMTGWRLGYIGGPKEIVSKISSLQSHSTSNPTSFAQFGGIEALKNGKQSIDKMRIVFEQRRNLIAQEIGKIAKLSLLLPDGAFYVFVNISQTGLTSSEFTEKLLESEKVAVVPGIVFGSDDHIRLSFASSDENITKGIARIKNFVDQL